MEKKRGKPAPKKTQIKELQKIFRKLNPDKDPKTVDWESYVGEDLSLEENLKKLKEAYPWYKWEERFGKLKEDEAIHYEVESLRAALEQLSPELADQVSDLLTLLESRAIEWIYLTKDIKKLQEDIKKLQEIPAKPIPPEIEKEVKPKIIKPEVVWFHAEEHLEFMGVDGVEYRIPACSLVKIPKIDAEKFEREGKGKISVLSSDDRDEIIESALAFLRRAGVFLPEGLADEIKKEIDYKKDKAYNMKKAAEVAGRLYETVIAAYGVPGARRFPRRLTKEEQVILEDYLAKKVMEKGGYITDEIRLALKNFFQMEFSSVEQARRKIDEFIGYILKGITPKFIIPAKTPPAWATTIGKIKHLASIGYKYVEDIAEETALPVEEVEKKLKELGLPIRHREK
jgi:hypothetical protein